MPKRVLSLRLLVRRWAIARAKAATGLIANYPFFAGLSGTLVATVMAILTYAALYEGRAEELRHAQENSRNLVQLISNDIARNVEIYDLSLQAVVMAAQQPQTWHMPEALRQRMLFDRATAASRLGGAYVIDATGHVKASRSNTLEALTASVSFADRDYFIAQQRDPHPGLFFSKPFHSRLRGGAFTIGLTRRINAPDGTFAGVALLGVRLDYFQQQLERIDLGPGGHLFILMRDGTLLASKPSSMRGAGSNYADLPNFAFFSRRDAGTYTSHSALDGVERIYTFAHVGNWPFIVVVAPAVEDVLAGWRRRSYIALAMTTLFGGAWVVVSWMLAFALRDKVVAEGKLARLAVTDPLTGLANRRALDSRLAQEWHHAVRERTPLSVLFFDIDHFKLFNDTYGHATGDEVLVFVAGRIAAGSRRATDLAARFGGEEFAMVLPGTALDAATRMAEKIRKRIESDNLTLSGTHHGRVTVSAGCASCNPPVGGSGAKLLAAADRLLYEAKEAGRNQVRSQQWTGEGAQPLVDSEAGSRGRDAPATRG
ncbi:GGDEF domain-containing protein [Paraburkholderia sp. CNPSo 3274]|uniref:GGDEF domain-containing protein n=1 Tax=Paraburkholderia sp. CNPSo 3274 TaxID=2940932 RepID=UPI0020B7FC8D|nr:GGDEF domain-containing protein [Paraburkholderia sp. CNPSo 3274]MCP3709617.1 GGDEF domain-containing protein [Paraburkholderia sp. CNPSo 3274]